jgi:integrase
MARPKKKDKERWTSSKFNIGYLEPINGVAYTRIAGKRQTTKLTWLEKNKKEAVQILEERIKLYLNPELEITHEEKPKEVTLFQAIKEFKEARFMDYSVHVKVVYRRTFNYFFSKDMVLDYEQMLQFIIKKNSDSTLKTSTRKKYLVQIRRFFEFCVERKYLEKNPVDIIGIPKVPKKSSKLIFEKEEIKKIVDFFLEKEHMKEYGLLFKFLSQTGLRIGEALTLSWEDVSDLGFRIHGKGDVDRYFPIINPEDDSILFPEVKEILNELRAINRDKVFHWKFPAQPQFHLNEAMKKLKIAKMINGLSRSIHTFRSTAEFWWENELMLPFDVICDLAGHSMAVREGHYRKERSMKEIAKVVKHHMA